MNRKFLQFTIGAANALPKALISANAEYLITMPSTSTLVLTVLGGTATADVVTITFTTADATYASHYAVVNALALANEPGSNPNAIITSALPVLAGTQQLITSVVIS